jgi:hypothetical protein
MQWTFKEKAVATALIFAWFHLARNISFLYFGLQAATLAVAFVAILGATVGRERIVLLVFFGCAWAYAACLTLLFANQYGSAPIGIARLYSIFPYILLLIIFPRRPAFTAMLWRWFAVFCGLAALSIPYQFLFGAIGWFAESSERVGLERFAALTGSLTTFGIVFGPAFVLSWLMFRGTVRIILIGALILGAIFSLQKASFGNLFLALGLLWLSGRLQFKFKLFAKFVVSAAIVVWLVWLFVPFVAEVASTMFMSSFGVGEEAGRSDVSLNQSVLERWLELPLLSIHFFGADKLLTGVGAFGASGGLGYPEIPMMHNVVGEIYMIFGALFGTAFVVLLGYYVARGLKLIRDKAARADDVMCANALVFVLSVINSLFSGGNFYHPVIAFALWLSFTELFLRPGASRAA